METDKIPTKEEILGRLERLPRAMRDSETSMLVVQDKIDEYELQIKSIENRIKQDVVNEMEGEKQKFRNDTERKIAVETRTKDDKEHRRIREERSKKIKEISEQKIGYAYIDRKFKAARTMANLIGGKENGR